MPSGYAGSEGIAVTSWDKITDESRTNTKAEEVTDESACPL